MMTAYIYVHCGPLPTIDGRPTPAWHPLATPVSYAFPTREAAERFAARHRERDPGRIITVG